MSKLFAGAAIFAAGIVAGYFIALVDEAEDAE